MNKKWNLFAALVFVSGVTLLAEPFSTEWNWENKRIQGKVKTITVEDKYGKTVDTYNKDGKKESKQRFDKAGKLIGKTILKYNDDGDLLQISYFSTDLEKPLYVETAIYKKKGIIESVTRLRGGKEMKSEKFVYDSNNHLEAIIIKNGPKEMKFKSKFNAEGNLEESTMLCDDIVRMRATMEDYKNGEPGTIKMYRGKDMVALMNYDYKFDEQGNWYEKTQKVTNYRNGEKVEKAHVTFKRKIDYYK